MAEKPIVTVEVVDPRECMRDWDPFLRPEWRWERVLELLDDPDGPRRTTRHDDDYIRHGRTFLDRWRSGGRREREKLQYKNAGMFYAFKLFDLIGVEPKQAFTIEAMLLANFPYEEIAHVTGTRLSAVEWYEAMFFNVRERLRNRMWILNQVLMPAMDRFAEAEKSKDDDADDLAHRFQTPAVIKPHMDMTLKFFSYYGGPVLCDFMLSGFKHGVVCHTQDEIGEYLDEQWNNQIRKRSAQSAGVFEINKYNVMDLFMVHANIISIAKGAEGQEERRTAIERHIYAMLTEIPWTVGSEAKEVFAGTAVGHYDELSAELRDEELLLVAAGEKVQALDEIESLVMPLSRTDKEVKH